jgi:hypothetical protein
LQQHEQAEDMRKSSQVIVIIGVQSLIVVSLLFISGSWVKQDRQRHDRNGIMVKQLDLTDLCLFTEARYTRHISQADLFSPFQDHPLSLEHFPSGSFVGPPLALRDHLAGRNRMTKDAGGLLP